MRPPIVALLLLVGLAADPALAEQNRLTTARDLYASARYDEALALLDGFAQSDMTSPNERRAVAQYRSLCLLALGRGDEAEDAIATVIAADPAYQPSEAEASPRVRSAFTEVRRRMLPDIATRRYQDAKARFDARDWAPAEQQFREVLALLDDPDMGGRLTDLRVLVTGFIDLAVAAATPPPVPPADPPAADPPPADPAAPASRPASVPAPPPPAPAAPSGPAVAGDPGVVPAVPISQDVPKVPATILAQCRERGVLELVIDEQGRVVEMTVRVSVHPTYDAMLLDAARNWRYRPAQLNGAPVTFRKSIQINVTR
jgi:TonB family protein